MPAIKPKNILSIPRLRGEWNAALADQLNQTLKQLCDQMTGGIVETVHTHSTYINADFSAPVPSTGLRIASGCQVKPASVELLELVQTRPLATAASLAASLEWDWDAGTIVLPQFAGLTGSAAWRIKLLVREAD